MQLSLRIVSHSIERETFLVIALVIFSFEEMVKAFHETVNYSFHSSVTISVSVGLGSVFNGCS
jgi:hypothetical protein